MGELNMDYILYDTIEFMLKFLSVMYNVFFSLFQEMAAEVFRAKCHAICNLDRKREGERERGYDWEKGRG